MKKENKLLKMNIQFFSEGEAGVGDDGAVVTDGDVGDTGDNVVAVNDEPKGLSEDEVTHLIETERLKWIEELEKKERLSKLSAEERQTEEALAKDNEIKELKQKLLTNELRAKATKELTKTDLPIELAELIDFSSKENMDTSLVKVKSIFTKAVEKEVLKKLRGSVPKGLSGATGSSVSLQKQIAESMRE